jgi:elongation factor Ts
MVTPEKIKTLRETTGAGFMDCKKALTESEGSVEKAVDWLRTKGLAAAAKKAGRVTAEGLVGVVQKGPWAVALEVNSETDFVARNDKFQGFFNSLLEIISSQKIETLETLQKSVLPTGRSVDEELSVQVATIGESLNIRRLEALSVTQGVVASYIHSAVSPQLGRIAVLVALESASTETSLLNDLGRQIAMHVAATKPLFLKVADVDQENLTREKTVLTEQARASGRPEDVIEKMVSGRLRKYFEEVVLEEQIFVVDGVTRIADLIAGAEKTVGAPVMLKGFSRIALGEGIDKPTTDFAAEVQAQAQL